MKKPQAAPEPTKRAERTKESKSKQISIQRRFFSPQAALPFPPLTLSFVKLITRRVSFRPPWTMGFVVSPRARLPRGLFSCRLRRAGGAPTARWQGRAAADAASGGSSALLPRAWREDEAAAKKIRLSPFLTKAGKRRPRPPQEKPALSRQAPRQPPGSRPLFPPSPRLWSQDRKWACPAAGDPRKGR